MANVASWRVEVVYATPARQEVITVSVPPGATVEEAIRASRMMEIFPEIDLSRQQVGVYGSPVALRDLVRDRDRVEIYRPLTADPKEARQRRARKK